MALPVARGRPQIDDPGVGAVRRVHRVVEPASDFLVRPGRAKSLAAGKHADVEPRQIQKQVVLDAVNALISPTGGYKATFGLGADARPDMNDRLLALAGNTKADGVIIYVIQFSSSGSDLEALLQTVASGPGSPYYFFAPDADTLRQVFRQIADHLSRLRLSRSGASAIAFVPARRDPHPRRDRAASKCPEVEENPGAIGTDG